MKQRADGRWLKVKSINGKKVYFYSTAKTERAAIKDIEKQLVEYAEKDEKGKTFQEVAEEWQTTPRYTQLSPTTQKRYDILLNHAFKVFADDYIKNIQAEDIENFLTDLSEQGFASKTIKHQFSIFKIIFKYAKMKRYIANDETAYVTVPDGKKAVKRRALTEDEVKIVEKNATTGFGLFAYFLLNTGLRRGEALALQYRDLDYDKKVIHITKSAYYVGNQPKLKRPKTEAGTRDIVFPDCLIKILPRGKQTNYIFHYPEKPDQIMTADVYERLWDKYQGQTGLDITAHMLRHTYATVLFEAGIDVKDAQNLMGHADIATTNNIYTHIREQRMADTADRLNAYLNSQN